SSPTRRSSDLAAGLLTHASDIDGDLLSAVLVSGPSHGTLSLNSNGSFSYTPSANYNGGDSFVYQVNDGTADSNLATVSLTITAVNDAPVATAESYTTAEDTALTVNTAAGLLKHASDNDGHPPSAVLVNGPSPRPHTLTSDGSFTYTPSANYNGGDSFVYQVNDGTADSNLATVSLTITAVNDAPLATAESYTAAEDTALTVNTAAGLLTHATDIDADPLSAVLVSGPSHGTLTLNSNGSFTYTPAANYNGSDA